MKKQFWGAYGDERLLVEISQVGGTNGQFHIYVNKFYQGIIHQIQAGEWVAYVDGRYITQGDDITILVDLVIEMSDLIRKEKEPLPG